MNDMSNTCEELKNDYKNRINRVMDFIEVHLDEALTLECLADVACFSRFHFHRVFQSITGECLAAYIQRIRLEKAATLLNSNPTYSITDIALICGFASSASFANAFTRHFGKTATVFRKDKNSISTQRYIHLPDKNSVVTELNIKQSKDALLYLVKGSDYERQVSVLDLPSWMLAYIRYTGPYKGDARLFHTLWNKLLTWAAPQGLMNRQDNIYLAIYHDNPEVTIEEKLKVSVCINIDPNTEVSGEIGKFTLPGGKYAICRFLVGAKDYSAAWGWMYGTWLPLSGYQPDDRLAFEWFPPCEQQEKNRKTYVDICIPVIKL